MGAQLLNAAGWRPDCTVANMTNLARVLPLGLAPGAPLIIGHPELMTNLNKENAEELSLWRKGKGGKLRIFASAFFQQSVGVSCVYTECPSLPPVTQCWAMGVDPVSSGPPESVLEGSILHALRAAEQEVVFGVARKELVDTVEVWAGNWKTSKRLLNWFNKGTLELTSAFASDIALTVIRLSGWLRCPLVLKEIPKDFFGNIDQQHQSPQKLRWRLLSVSLLMLSPLV